MPFTTSLAVRFVSPRLLPATAPPVEATSWRISTTIDDEGNATDHQSPIETIPVPASLSGDSLLASGFTFARDFSEPYAATRADFVVVTVRTLPDPGFLFRSKRLTANPAPQGGGTVGINIIKGRRGESIAWLQTQASKLVPRPLSGLPPGFTGTVSRITVSARPGLIDLVVTGSFAPERPRALPGLPAPPAPPPVRFTLTTSLEVKPSENLHDVEQLVVVAYVSDPRVDFAGGDPGGVVAAILNFFRHEIAQQMAGAVASLSRQLVDQLVSDSLSGAPLGDILPPGVTKSVQKVTISGEGLAVEGAAGAFVEIPTHAVVSRPLGAGILGERGGASVLLPRQQADWRWCNKCQGLFFKRAGGAGRCPAGGGHSEAGSFKYLLVYNYSLPHGQDNWRWCRKCEGLFFAGNPTAGSCPVGGAHDATGSWNYSLHMNAPSDRAGQRNWRWCNKCQGLFFGGNPSQGVCPVGGAHSSSGSGDYAVQYSS